MSLQGTLDTFALPDVLRLLASTRKTGYLRLDGTRGSGGLWLTDGLLSGVDPLAQVPVPPSAPDAESLCDVLRAPDGAFAFEPGAASPVGGEPVEVVALLAAAEELLVEWRALAAVVPSLRCSIDLAAELSGERVEITAAQWSRVVAVGGGTTVGRLGELLALGELAVSRVVRDLVEAGLVAVGPEPTLVADLEPADDSLLGVLDDVEEAAPVQSAAAHGGHDGFLRRPLGNRPAGARAPGVGMPLSASLGELASLAPTKRPFPGAASPPPPAADDEAEVARRLAALGPEAAAAVAAATEAPTPEARAAAIEAIEAEAEGEPVNRSALLKFLSSVRS